MEAAVERMLAVLDADDGDCEAEAGHEGCCDAQDDDLTWRGSGWATIGDDADAEPDDDDMCLAGDDRGTFG